MGRENTKCETKKGKMDFRLGGMQKEGESKVLPPLRRHKDSMCKSKERGSRTRKKKKREQPRRSHLEKKEDNHERAVRGEENKKERAKYCCI